jgi:hypothetical protein
MLLYIFNLDTYMYLPLLIIILVLFVWFKHIDKIPKYTTFTVRIKITKWLIDVMNASYNIKDNKYYCTSITHDDEYFYDILPHNNCFNYININKPDEPFMCVCDITVDNNGKIKIIKICLDNTNMLYDENDTIYQKNEKLCMIYWLGAFVNTIFAPILMTGIIPEAYFDNHSLKLLHRYVSSTLINYHINSVNVNIIINYDTLTKKIIIGKLWILHTNIYKFIQETIGSDYELAIDYCLKCSINWKTKFIRFDKNLLTLFKIASKFEFCLRDTWKGYDIIHPNIVYQ